MTDKINITIRGMNGQIMIFDDVELMTRACGRLTQVMVFQGRSFTLFEAIGDRSVAGATILEADVKEFMRIFKEEERSADEKLLIEEIGDQKFIIAIDRDEELTALYAHELSHVLFYYDEEYKNRITSLWDRLNPFIKESVIAKLKASGYEEVEYIDEWFAHLLYGFEEREEMSGGEETIEFYNKIVDEFSALFQLESVLTA